MTTRIYPDIFAAPNTGLMHPETRTAVVCDYQDQPRDTNAAQLSLVSYLFTARGHLAILACHSTPEVNASRRYKRGLQTLCARLVNSRYESRARAKKEREERFFSVSLCAILLNNFVYLCRRFFPLFLLISEYASLSHFLSRPSEVLIRGRIKQ